MEKPTINGELFILWIFEKLVPINVRHIRLSSDDSFAVRILTMILSLIYANKAK